MYFEIQDVRIEEDLSLKRANLDQLEFELHTLEIKVKFKKKKFYFTSITGV